MPVTQFSYIPLPAGLPNEIYTATVSIYDDANGQGLDAVQVDGGQGIGKQPAISETAIVKQTALDPVGEITDQDVMLWNGVYLHRVELPDRLNQGQRMRVRLEWWRTVDADAPRSTALTFVGNDWTAFSSKGDCLAGLNAKGTGKLLNWCEISIPPMATGNAELSIVIDGKSYGLTIYNLDEIARQFTEPTFTYSTRPSAEIEFPQVGAILGATVGNQLAAGQPAEVTLLWKSSAIPEIGYKVFVHLMDANDQVIAQSDTEPAEGQRPTYGWVQGEYIIDKHTLTYNQPTFTGEVRLAVGLYDPVTGQRVKLSDGSDRIVLPLIIMVK